MITRIAQQALKQLGLRTPPSLIREEPRPWENPWRGRKVILGGEGSLRDALSHWLKQHDADVATSGPCDTIIYVTNLTSPEKSDVLREFFSPTLRELATNGRIIVVAPPLHDAHDALSHAALYGLQGFVRSLAKEVGAVGTTANLLYASSTTESSPGLQGAIHFLASARAAFITGQVLNLTTSVSPSPEQGLFQRQEDTVLITGAAGGIGSALAHLFSREGCAPILVDHPSKKDALEHLAEEVRGIHLAVDLTTASANDAIMKVLEKPLRAVIFNAGITRDRTLKRMKEEEWRQVVDVNFTAIEKLQNALLKKNLFAANSSIVNISSLSGWAGNFGQTQYAYSKSALLGFTKYHAPLLAQKNIRVNAIIPGFINTPMTAAMPLMTRLMSQRLATLAQAGEAEDVAQAAVFLASDLGAGCQGQFLRVCGGHLLGA